MGTEDIRKVKEASFEAAKQGDLATHLVKGHQVLSRIERRDVAGKGPANIINIEEVLFWKGVEEDYIGLWTTREGVELDVQKGEFYTAEQPHTPLLYHGHFEGLPRPENFERQHTPDFQI